MAVWNFEQLQKEITGYGVRTEKGMFYSQAAVDRLLEVLARSVPVDEQFYFSKHPDVHEAWKSGDISSAAQHFVEHGFYEDRLPCDIIIDEQDYLKRYPDIADGIETRVIESATDHWIRFGRFEGRVAYLQRR